MQPDPRALPDQNSLEDAKRRGRERRARLNEAARRHRELQRRQEVSMVWRWTVQQWRSGKSRWGVQLVCRPRLRHSQLRVQIGRRRLTVMAAAHGSVTPDESQRGMED